jgi:hypothetical protein
VGSGRRLAARRPGPVRVCPARRRMADGVGPVAARAPYGTPRAAGRTARHRRQRAPPPLRRRPPRSPRPRATLAARPRRPAVVRQRHARVLRVPGSERTVGAGAGGRHRARRRDVARAPTDHAAQPARQGRRRDGRRTRSPGPAGDRRDGCTGRSPGPLRRRGHAAVGGDGGQPALRHRGGARRVRHGRVCAARANAHRPRRDHRASRPALARCAPARRGRRDDRP